MTNHCRHYEDKNKGVELWKKDFNFIPSLKRVLSIYIVYLFHLISFNIDNCVLQAGYIKLGIIWHEINYISCAAYLKFSPSLPPSLCNEWQRAIVKKKEDKNHMKDHHNCALNTWYCLIIKCTRQFKAKYDDLHNYVSEI